MPKHAFNLVGSQYKFKVFVEFYYLETYLIKLTQKQFPRPIGHRNSIPLTNFCIIAIYGKLFLKIDSISPNMAYVCHTCATA